MSDSYSDSLGASYAAHDAVTHQGAHLDRLVGVLPHGPRRDALSFPNRNGRVHVGACTDIGPVRSLNEDCVRTWRDLAPSAPIATAGYLFAVADGVGGRAKGDVASALAIGTLFAAYYSADTRDPGDALTRAYEQANAAIYAQGSAQSADRAMATTLVAGAISGTMLTVANVGDSRAYLVRDGAAVRQISRDHSLVAEEVRAGRMTPAEAARSSQRNVITRALGAEPTVMVDVFALTVQPDDIIVLCSDGLYDVVHATQIGHLARDMPPEQAAADLVAIANTHGARDNISAVVVTVEHVSASSLQ